MFLYWEGYEIDGSDTDFDIVLPENQEAAYFAECFLDIPLFGDSEPDFYYYDKKTCKNVSISKEELMDLLKQGNHRELCIDINCKTMDAFTDDIREKLYSFSEKRTPHESAYGKTENPCMAPIRQLHHTRGELTVSLTMLAPGTKQSWYTEPDAAAEGYVLNETLLYANDRDYPCFTINVGPGFYYEYAMFIIDFLVDHMPGLAVAGGLDCNGGWTDGCTYASSIYGYEKIQLPVLYSIRNTLKRLTEYDIACSYRQYYKSGWHFDLISDFRLENMPEEKVERKALSTKEYLMSFAEYIDHIEKTLENQTDTFSSICDTAVHIILPKPNRFIKNPMVPKRLTEAIEDIENIDESWYYKAYMAFAVIDGKPVCEFRVGWRMKQYFSTLLDLMESGDIDFIKTETYDRRSQ